MQGKDRNKVQAKRIPHDNPNTPTIKSTEIKSVLLPVIYTVN
jgi:hypothetical protein